MTSVDSFNKRIEDLWRKYGETITEELSPLLYKGFFNRKDLSTDKRTILFIGLNPSYSPTAIKSFLKGTEYEESSTKEEDIDKYHKFKNIDTYRRDIIEIQDIAFQKHPFFERMRKISHDLGWQWSHLDLFYVRLTDQKAFKRIVFKTKQRHDFAIGQMEITRDIIRDLNPNMIVIANAFARDIMKENMPGIDFGKLDEDHCVYHMTINNNKDNKYVTLLCGILSAMDTGSYERLKWHIKYIQNTFNLH